MMKNRQAWSWFRYNSSWALALLLAGLFSCWTPRGWRRIAKAFLLWFGFCRSGANADAKTVAMRLATCDQCVLFYRPLGTCGTPIKRDLRGHGCWCYLLEKAKLKYAQCYLDSDIEPGYPGGWEDAAKRASDSVRDH